MVFCRWEDSTSALNWVTSYAHEGGKRTEDVWRWI